MQGLPLLLQQLGLGGGVLFGAPLVLMGLALRGLSRRQLGRLLCAARHRRRLTELADGPVTVVGTARRAPDGRLHVADAGAAVAIEPPIEARIRDGAPLIVHGLARAEAAPAGGYRDDARRWTIDARRGEALVLTGRPTLAARVLRLRAQAVAGGLAFSVGLLLVVLSALASLVEG